MSAKDLQAQVCLQTNRVWTKQDVISLGENFKLSASTSLKAMSDCADIKAFYGTPAKPGQYAPISYYKSLIPNDIYTPVYYDNSKYSHWFCKWFTICSIPLYVASCVFDY